MKLTQNQRVLNALRRAGQRGVCQVDFDKGTVCDGGTPIPRLAARIYDLRKEYLIASGGERHGSEVYVFEGIRTPSTDRPILLRNGFARAYGCRCGALGARPEQVCKPYAVAVTPGAQMFECRRQEQEVRRAA